MDLPENVHIRQTHARAGNGSGTAGPVVPVPEPCRTGVGWIPRVACSAPGRRFLHSLLHYLLALSQPGDVQRVTNRQDHRPDKQTDDT